MSGKLSTTNDYLSKLDEQADKFKQGDEVMFVLAEFSEDRRLTKGAVKDTIELLELESDDYELSFNSDEKAFVLKPA